MRTNFDFAPFRRSTVGFDRLFDLLESTSRVDTVDGYPPFDIERETEDSYRITLAVAGFRRDEIEIVAHNDQLTVTGRKAEEEDVGQYLHRGIATRAFERRFSSPTLYRCVTPASTTAYCGSCCDARCSKR